MSLAFFPKSLQNKFGFCLGSQRQLPKRDNTLYLWPRSKGWMQAVKRTFNLLRLKSQICFILASGVRLLRSLTNQDLISSEEVSCINFVLYISEFIGKTICNNNITVCLESVKIFFNFASKESRSPIFVTLVAAG